MQATRSPLSSVRAGISTTLVTVATPGNLSPSTSIPTLNSENLIELIVAAP